LTDTTPWVFRKRGDPRLCAQPAGQIIRLDGRPQKALESAVPESWRNFRTGVDVNHPVLCPVLLPGYDFTPTSRELPEWLDWPLAETPTGAGQSAVVQQQSAAILDQQSAAILDGKPCGAFGHGTMTSGVGPPRRAHGEDPAIEGVYREWYRLSLTSLPRCTTPSNTRQLVNMSFDLSAPSPALSQAVSYARSRQCGLWWPPQEMKSTSARVYPAAISGYVMGVRFHNRLGRESSSQTTARPTFGSLLPANTVISTFPGGSYAAASGTSFSSPLVAGTAALLSNARSGLNIASCQCTCTRRVLTPDLNHETPRCVSGDFRVEVGRQRMVLVRTVILEEFRWLTLSLRKMERRILSRSSQAKSKFRRCVLL